MVSALMETVGDRRVSQARTPREGRRKRSTRSATSHGTPGCQEGALCGPGGCQGAWGGGDGDEGAPLGPNEFTCFIVPSLPPLSVLLSFLPFPSSNYGKTHEM